MSEELRATDDATGSNDNISGAGDSETGYKQEESSIAQVDDSVIEGDSEMKSKAQEEGEAEPEAFVNQGLARWEESRSEWLTLNRVENPERTAHATPLEVDDIIDVIFMSSRQVREQGGPRFFPQPVPLPQMVDILQDLWEAEGLDA